MPTGLRVTLLIAAAIAVLAALRGAMDRQPDVRPALDVANGRLAALAEALEAYGAEHRFYPEPEQWLTRLGLSSSEAADPFAQEGQAPAVQYWSDGRWYTLSSAGPDAALFPQVGPRSVDPAQTLESTRSFHPELLSGRTAEELRALLASREIAGDIRWRSAIYDPTNGLLSAGDIVRWGGPSPGPLRERATGQGELLAPLASVEFEATPLLATLPEALLASVETQAAAEPASP